MGWYYRNGGGRKDLIHELAQNRELTNEQGMTVTTTCLAHCYRGGVFSGVLWSVWERQFTKQGCQCEPTERWIGCDLMRCDQGEWGYKPLDESMGPYYYSCPVSYLKLVPPDQFGGNEEWREGVVAHHARLADKRKAKATA